ncbi:F-box/FBD/LRR-repeat protein At1g13570-like [Ipomoea triloba]|uniref:F-box/FBD/LRR-repeat protein At1g13570-like n=1 Tax=Ipomoea triloba TaxID=35885 RepID=UPI00125E50F4|nr:F-box/FBD/LRR-repeat protein At1g13570-like [Ipomoea triloba]
MASYRRSRTTSAARKDMISQLPDDVKEKILECLPTSDAARTALLSTDWKDVWLRNGRLVFDTHFFKCLRKCEGDKRVALVSIINDILLHRAGPVKKFTLVISCPEDPKPQQSDLDRWCRYLSRNGIEELNISISGKKYRLPSCIVSCRTITQLKLGGEGFDFDCLVNAGGVFPGVTSLVFRNVHFKNRINGVVSNLEKLAFRYCVGVNNFKISAPKLKRLDLASACVFNTLERRWLLPHLRSIETLCIDGHLLSARIYVLSLHLKAIAAQAFPTARNLQPSVWDDTARTLMRDSDDCFINQDFEMLKTIKIESFSGSILEMHFVKALLSKSPALEKIVIQESADIDATITPSLI